MENPNHMPSRWLTVEQASQYLQCSRNFLDRDRVARLHGIPFYRLGRHLRYKIADLDNFIEATRSGSSDDGQDGVAI